MCVVIGCFLVLVDGVLAEWYHGPRVSGVPTGGCHQQDILLSEFP